MNDFYMDKGRYRDYVIKNHLIDFRNRLLDNFTNDLISKLPEQKDTILEIKEEWKNDSH